MNLSRVVICLVLALCFAKSVSGQQGSITSQTTQGPPTQHVSSTPVPKPAPKVAVAALTVMVFNFRQVSTDILSNAEREADQIFAHAGMKIVWQECPTG